jgi:hypothetical protein
LREQHFVAAIILEDDIYCNIIGNFLANWSNRKASFSDLSLWWDQGKQWLKFLSIKYCSLQARQRRHYRVTLEKEISVLKGQIDSGVITSFPRYKSCLAAVARLDAVESEGLRVRS